MAEAIIDLPDIIQSLQNKRWTGTLEIVSGEGERRTYLFLREGTIQHVKTDHSRVVLGRALYEMQLIDEADYVMTLVDYERTGRRTGEVLIELGLVDEKAIRDALVFQAREDVLDTFNWQKIDAKFHPGDPPLPNVFGPEQLEITLHLGGMSVLMEAARRADEWGLIAQQIPCEHDVLAPTDPAGLPAGLVDRRLAVLIDGYRSAHEIASAAPLNTLEGLKALADLLEAGHLKRLEPAELVQVGAEAERDQDYEKALKVYELAAERGLEHVDLYRRIALAYQRLGRTRQALTRWLELAERCAKVDRVDLGIEALGEGKALEPRDETIRRRLIELLVRSNRAADAAAELRELIALADERKARPAELAQLMGEVLELDPEDRVTLRRAAELQLDLGERIYAMTHYDDLATLLLAAGEMEEAVAVYYKILEIDAENLDARLLLAQTLGKMAMTDDAVREYRRLADILYRSGVIGNSINWPFLIKVYESIVELEPSSTAAWEWLAKAYLENGQQELAVSRYLGMAQSLEPAPGESPPPEILQPLRRVVELDPGRLDIRRRLAEAHLALNQVERATRALRELAEQALGQELVEEARAAYEDALRHQPFDMDSRRGLAGIHERQGQMSQAQEIWRATGAMYLRAGLFDDACQDLRRALSIRRDDLEALIDYARAEEARGRQREAAAVYAAYAEAMLSRGNQGSAREALDAAGRLMPEHPKVAALTTRLSAIKA